MAGSQIRGATNYNTPCDTVSWRFGGDREPWPQVSFPRRRERDTWEVRAGPV